MTTNRPIVRALLTAAALAALTLTAACGSGADARPISKASASADSAKALDPCALVGESTIASALGTEVTKAGRPGDAPRGRSCTWTVADPTSVYGDADVVLTTYHGSEFYLDGSMGSPVAGIADEAQGDPQGGLILFRKGEEVVEVHVLTGGQSALGPRVVPLANAVAAAIKA